MNTNIYKESLVNEKNILTLELESIGMYNTDLKKWEAIPEALSNPEPDESDMDDHSEVYEERTAKVAILGSRFKDIVDALEKIDNNNYGKCEICGEMIEEDRLDANPSARTCKTHME